MKISNNPPKGTNDWFPKEYKIRKYIFDTWRKVCLSFGYEEYLTPIVENAEIYRAKSGEDIGGKELVTFVDKAGRELAVRPEMTPSVTRMVTRVYNSTQKPIRYFSIANFMRNEKPQRGRNREFWQLNADIFGSESINADIEILQLALEIMLAFNPPAGSFTLFINSRDLIEGILNDYIQIADDKRQELVRTMDKWDKLSEDDMSKKLNELGLSPDQIEALKKFMQSTDQNSLLEAFPDIEKNQGYQDIAKALSSLEELGYSEWVTFQPNIIRGFDYYDGIVFEVFDNNPENSRSLFGGGRYDGLATLFEKQSFPATGFAPGDETLKLFLESWDLLDPAFDKGDIKSYFIPLLDEELNNDVLKIAKQLREDGSSVEVTPDVVKLGKALEFADKKGVDYTVIFGQNEKAEGIYKLKEMSTGNESIIT